MRYILLDFKNRPVVHDNYGMHLVGLHKMGAIFFNKRLFVRNWDIIRKDGAITYCEVEWFTARAKSGREIIYND